ncbi:MAG: 2,3-bisphosphoglycerate-independent phosphoglycerate mutase [Candidatus Edwardsbacteria bacterium]|nr:2,3-bisphosphoglycerate-independent phosphoglycerate mutase [Candidatus Edwardsbacteria bacterium]MBU1576905.1 2,3-bisphosphoglycerate-independent phosphoglycerate mutase [Candidatus Edwardsbacteria bacterium]MBU2463098.1 2,3-bisphosphoglycerate-independent phosphoglycerate mutase [Candidatus Edwardsbacteria bacterium]MBU2594266.1 2,3-bisphosphoglycerate-independent phosphoglycerate mutase [Candidatus Edwardsbacteria bacterium]
MLDDSLLQELLVSNDKKIVLIVADGLGGLPRERDGQTELESAAKPHIDALAIKSVCGLTIPVSYGITPGSGPAHLSLFGYDPIKYQIGRGVLEALGIGLEMTPRDVAARANFATMDPNGLITDRRAGRIPTEKNMELCAKMQAAIPAIDGVEVMIRHGKEHRFVVLFRGDGLSGNLHDTDPQREGLAAIEPKAFFEEDLKLAAVTTKFIAQANQLLKDQHPANTLLMRGFAKHPDIPSMNKRFGLKAAAIATYPMYKGLAKLVGMTELDTGQTIEDEFETLRLYYNDFDFFYIHIKKTDSYGEDGNFNAKVQVITELDDAMPMVSKLNPDVLVITSDHSTPARMKGHSWHPNPFMLHSPYVRPDGLDSFNERNCAYGSLGCFPAVEAMPLMLANALKLGKFGA